MGLPADSEILFDQSNCFITVQTQIDIARYSKLISPKDTGHNEEREEKLLERCPPGHEGTKLVEIPTVDLHCRSVETFNKNNKTRQRYWSAVLVLRSAVFSSCSK